MANYKYKRGWRSFKRKRYTPVSQPIWVKPSITWKAITGWVGETGWVGGWVDQQMGLGGYGTHPRSISVKDVVRPEPIEDLSIKDMDGPISRSIRFAAFHKDQTLCMSRVDVQSPNIEQPSLQQ